LVSKTRKTKTLESYSQTYKNNYLLKILYFMKPRLKYGLSSHYNFFKQYCNTVYFPSVFWPFFIIHTVRFKYCTICVPCGYVLLFCGKVLKRKSSSVYVYNALSKESRLSACMPALNWIQRMKIKYYTATELGAKSSEIKNV